jgi:hypothetical protein
LWPLAGVARQVAELELLLHAFDRLALAPFLDLNDKSRPSVGIDDAVGRRSSTRLKGLHRGFGLRTERAVDASITA